MEEEIWMGHSGEWKKEVTPSRRGHSDICSVRQWPVSYRCLFIYLFLATPSSLQKRLLTQNLGGATAGALGDQGALGLISDPLHQGLCWAYWAVSPALSEELWPLEVYWNNPVLLWVTKFVVICYDGNRKSIQWFLEKNVNVKLIKARYYHF